MRTVVENRETAEHIEELDVRDWGETYKKWKLSTEETNPERSHWSARSKEEAGKVDIDNKQDYKNNSSIFKRAATSLEGHNAELLPGGIWGNSHCTPGTRRLKK